jgi:hypothetical protein
VSNDSDLGFGLVEVACAVVDLVMPADDRFSPSSVRASRSAEEKNLFMSSARVVGDAPLMDVPLMMVTFSVLALENKSWAALVAGSGEASGLGSAGRDCRVFTAVNPMGGDWDMPVMPFDLAFSPFASSAGGGEL